MWLHTRKGMTMKKLLLFISLLTLFLTAGAAQAQYTGVVSIESVTAMPGDKVGVTISLSDNNDEIAAMTIPIRFFTDDLTLDSISYINSLLTNKYDVDDSVDNVANGAVIRALPPVSGSPVSGITAESGSLARLWFTISPAATPAINRIDSANVDSTFSYGHITMHYVLQMDFSDVDGNTLWPDVVPGEIVVQVPTDIDDELGNGLPTSFALAQNYPNPFNPSTVIEFSLPTASPVKLEVFNILGQHVSTLINGQMPAGTHQATFDASPYTSGIYFYRLTYEGGAFTKKMAFLK